MPEGIKTAKTLSGLVIFSLGNAEYGGDLREISAIINPAELKEGIELSGPSPALIINEMRIPLIDLYKSFGQIPAGPDIERRILVAEPGNKIFGFVVDRVNQIITFGKEHRVKPEFTPSEGDEYITGTLSLEGRTVYLPDLNSLYRLIDE